MVSPAVTSISVFCALAFTQFAQGQQAIGNATDFSGGLALAQNNTPIEQSRLYRPTGSPGTVGVNADGTALADTEVTSSDDDSFGAQQILKSEVRNRTFALTGGISVIYTDNVGLANRGARHDVFAVLDAGASWSPRLGKEWEGTVGLRASVFRYDRTSALDFENLGFGTGLAWTPQSMRGVSFFGRYDFTELLNREGDQVLMEHALTLGAQKSIALGRSHALSFGAIGSFGLSDPAEAQRSQLGLFVGYHLQLARKLETDFLYRPAVYFYTDSSRTDFNQIVSWTLRYRFTEWAELNASFSYGMNTSNRSVFDYDVLTTGASAGVKVTF